MILGGFLFYRYSKDIPELLNKEFYSRPDSCSWLQLGELLSMFGLIME